MATGARIRVVLFITELALGGTPRRVQALAERLDRSRFEPFVLSLMPGGAIVDTLRSAGVRVETLAVRSKCDLLAAFRLWTYLRRVRPQVLHAFNFHANLLAKAIGSLLAGVPVVIVSEASVESAKPGWRVWLDRGTARLAHAHYANAEAVRKKLIEREAIPPNRIWVVPTGVDTEAFTPRDADEDLRARLAIPPGTPVVVCVARLDKYKGQEVLLEACHLERTRPYRLIFVGAGPLESFLRSKAAEMGILDRVTFAGSQPPEVVSKFLANADCFVLSSNEEGLPGSVLEAMAMGRPVVATNVGGLLETQSAGATVLTIRTTVPRRKASLPEAILKKLNIGWQVTAQEDDSSVAGLVLKKENVLVPPNDPQTLAEEIAKVLRDPEGAAAMGRSARNRVEQVFSLEQMVRKTEMMYEALLGTQQGGDRR